MPNNYAYSVSNILGHQKSNDEFYTSSDTVKKLTKILRIPKKEVIWMPFDKKESEFVRQFSKTNKIIRTHKDDESIKNRKDFYSFTPNEKWNLIISNPPFSKKRMLIERCLELKKPFCLLYGCTIFSQSMGNTLNKCDFYFIQNNCKFTNCNGETKSFQCCWVMSKSFKKKYFKNLNQLD